MKLGRWIAAGCLLAACGNAGKTDLPAGQHDLGDGMSAVVHEVVDPVAPDTAFEAKYGTDADPPAGSRFVAVDLEYFNRSDHVVEFTFAYGTNLHTSAGHSEEPLMDPPTDKLPGVPHAIPPNSFARGWQVFTVPDTERPTELILYGKIGHDPISVKL